MGSLRFHTALVLVFACVNVGCGGDGGVGTSPSDPGPFTLTFFLDATFQDPHGGQSIAIALVRSADGSVVDEDSGVVSATQGPSFSFSTGAVLQRGTAYEVHYWIDSNIGGGTAGMCDPKEVDHQWSVEFPSPTNDVMFTTSHNPSLTEDVCSTFS